jgi:RNA polymerase sigma-70 factor (ECF subfamily)
MDDEAGSSEVVGVEPARQLFERLNNGDADAVERAFLAYEPCLRKVLRHHISRRLRAKFDSVDVIQSVWTNVLQRLRGGDLRFTDETHLRSFLVRLALCRFIDLCRRHRNSLERERPLTAIASKPVPPAPGDRPTAILRAKELLDRLMDLCPPAHRDLVRLRAMGLSLAEIADRSGYHEGSIRRIFSDLERRLDARDARMAVEEQEGSQNTGTPLPTGPLRSNEGR